MENILISVQIININRIQYTSNLIFDLLRQTHRPEILVVDQGSDEIGTDEALHQYALQQVRIIRNKKNIPINRLWDSFYHTAVNKYLCFLNNDIRITSNFIEDTLDIFGRESKVGIVVHATNHPSYNKVTELKYKIIDTKIVQGWDFSIRRKLYRVIPSELRFYGGDNWLFNSVYNAGYKVAVVFSSPVIHYHSVSREYLPKNAIIDHIHTKRLKINKLQTNAWFNRQHPSEGFALNKKESG